MCASVDYQLLWGQLSPLKIDWPISLLSEAFCHLLFIKQTSVTDWFISLLRVYCHLVSIKGSTGWLISLLRKWCILPPGVHKGKY